MNDASGLEPGKTATIFAERKVIRLKRRIRPFRATELVKKTWRPTGQIDVTTGLFDQYFDGNMSCDEKPVDERAVCVCRQPDPVSILVLKGLYGNFGSVIEFEDLSQLLAIDVAEPLSLFPAVGRIYFFACNRQYQILLCEIVRLGADSKLHCEPPIRDRQISGTFIYKPKPDEL